MNEAKDIPPPPSPPSAWTWPRIRNLLLTAGAILAAVAAIVTPRPAPSPTPDTAPLVVPAPVIPSPVEPQPQPVPQPAGKLLRITADEERPAVGAAVFLDAEASPDADLLWDFDGLKGRSLERGKIAVVKIAAADQYRIVCSAAWPGGGHKLAAITIDARGVIPPAPPSPSPPPGPAPPPPPGPAPPSDEFAAAVRGWLQSVPHYDKATALAIADVYATVGSQGSDPARSSGWNLDSFAEATKAQLRLQLDSDVMAAWAEKFFRPLATKQSELFKTRGLKASDAAGIAKLWLDTAAAIKAGAF